MSTPIPTYRTELQRVLNEEVPKSMSQRWLAEQVGVHESLISRIANGLHCSDDLKARIAEALRRSKEDVFPDEVPA